MRDVDHAVLYEHPAGRIYTRWGGRLIAPAYLANDYIQWDEEQKKYGLYQYSLNMRPPTEPSHDRVGAEPTFERAVEWLLRARQDGRVTPSA